MKTFIFQLLILSVFFVDAQEIEYELPPPDFIKTIQFTGGYTEYNGTPIIPINGKIHLSFDDINASEADYYYTVEHYNYDWTPSKLSKNEYIEGFDNLRMFDYVNSLNTLQSFSHHKLSIPNKDLRGFKVSGNYMLKIFDAENRLLFSRKFIVYETLAKVKTQIRRSRDLNFIKEKQVVNFSVSSEDFIFNNPEETVNATIVQNNDFNEAIRGIKHSFTSGRELIYRHDQETAFWGSNEYLFFDNKELRMATRQIDRVELGADLYHTFLTPDIVRDGRKYIYNPDINGGFKLNTTQGTNTREGEYTKVHFYLNNYKPLEGGEIHLYGRFNNYILDDSTHLKYNKKTGLYETELLLKQGFYNYKYVYLDAEGNFDPGFVSGNHDITENEYIVLVYYKDIGARYDRLVGIGVANSKNIIN
ncbi:MAG: DUF5103 domain-containing protein [Bacteroidota bacterium]